MKTDKIYKILKKFVIDECVGADFDQGQQNTLKVLHEWWLKNRTKIEKELKK